MRRDGFTLLEILVSIGLTAAVVLAAFQIFAQVMGTIERARPDRSRDLAAQVFLDRFEGELQGTLLVVKPEEEDRLSFPWAFVVEDRVFGTNDSDALRFITQNPARLPGRPGTGVRVVSYGVEPSSEADRFDLFRLEEAVPESLEKDVKVYDGEPVLEDVHRFALRMQDEETGEWRDGWDSTDLAMLDALPSRVEVAVQLYEEDPDGELVPGAEHSRSVQLYVRPFGGEEELALEDGQAEAVEPCDTGGATISDCINEIAGNDAQLRADLQEMAGRYGVVCWHGDSDAALQARRIYTEATGEDSMAVCR